MPALLDDDVGGNTPLAVLWVGYGKMGRPMCDRVAAASHRVSVIDTGASQREDAAKSGLMVVDDAQNAAASTDVIVTSLPHDHAFREVLVGSSGLLAACRRGTVLIDTSTISVQASREVSEAAASGGIAYVRAPVSGTVVAAANGSLSSFVSGPDEALARAAAIIHCYARTVIPVGLDEQARVVKLAVNLMVHTLMVSLSEAYALCRKGGVAPKVAIDAICASAIASPHLNLKADCLFREDFTPTFTVTQTRKDLRLVNQEARDLGVPVFLGAAIEQVLAAAESSGMGELDYIAHGKLIAQLSGLPTD